MSTSGTVTINNHANASIRSGAGHDVYGQGIIVDAGAVTINNDGLVDGHIGGIVNKSADAMHVVNSSTGTIQCYRTGRPDATGQ
jgi:hypothetical protein